MKVKELIVALSECDQEAEVFVRDYEGDRKPLSEFVEGFSDEERDFTSVGPSEYFPIPAVLLA